MKKDKDKRVSVSLSLTLNEKEELMKIAKSYGLSLSAFLRVAAAKFVENDNKVEVNKDGKKRS
ncbi:hypothetical protein [Streptococcus dysgalactiae]|uniref:hypothetical protein n=1 Tax=Streptococcus dysgalactiae TaxID=1334 RepID=UPI00061819DD|nr:hypothetical protein [Streptococcus dysgalactiae]SLM21248.1 Ribbon-helix-helix protein, copG family [Streptococcus dysgalactiae subsp. equisimilis]SQE86134.1 Ribbon-helix-helix protein, copG family [Streptococcus dysgalactiae subsp. equisimilis]